MANYNKVKSYIDKLAKNHSDSYWDDVCAFYNHGMGVMGKMFLEDVVEEVCDIFDLKNSLEVFNAISSYYVNVEEEKLKEVIGV